MKKIVSSLLILVLSFALLSGCAREPEPLRICIDLDATKVLMSFGGSTKDDLDDFQHYLENEVGLTNIVFEYIPGSGTERETELSRIRTEIMSGGGPDVFIAHCIGNDYPEWTLGDGLFEMPEKSMELGLFLPLDEYIENAQYAEWDKFTRSIMDAGKNEEGQQLIPLTYSVHTAMYRAEDFSYTPTKITWEDMLQSEVLYDTAARVGDAEGMDRTYDSAISSVIGALADFKEEELLFTEEELLQRVTEICELTAYTWESTPYYTPGWSEGSIGVKFNRSINANGNRESRMLNGLSETDTLTLVPLYSDDGGCTATILTFAAVNRNTQRPQDAFSVIDFLLSTENQQNGALFQKHIFRGSVDTSMPIHEELMSSTCPTNPYMDLSDENFAAVCAVRDQITNVEFAGKMHAVLEDMIQDCVKAYKSSEDYTGIVRDAYVTMKQMIAE